MAADWGIGNRYRGRYRNRYRKHACWDSDWRHRVLLGCFPDSEVRFEGGMRAGCYTEQGSIPIPISISIGRIGSIAWRRCVKERAFSEALATEGTEFTGRFFLSPSTRHPLLQPGCVEMGKNVRLCVLGALCGRTFLTSGRSKRPWRSKLGVEVGIGIGIERTRPGIRTGGTGYRNRIVGVLPRLGSEV